VLFSGPALAYDESLAKTYEGFFASFEEKQVPKALYLILMKGGLMGPMKYLGPKTAF
jgi:hypothetical protein